MDVCKLSGKQKKLFELRLKMNETRKANQTAMVAEKKRMYKSIWGCNSNQLDSNKELPDTQGIPLNEEEMTIWLKFKELYKKI
ncbi:hypothetical protein Tco_1557644, partial [Tanacetum coccineum]